MRTDQNDKTTPEPEKTRDFSGIDAFGELRPEKNEPGALNRTILNKRPLATQVLSNTKYLDIKTTRTMCSKHGINLNELEASYLLYTHLAIFGKLEIGCKESDLIDWSGARQAWKKRIEHGISEAIKKGMIEQIPYKTGHRILVSEKGNYIIEDYDREFEALRERLELQRTENLIKLETKRINKEIAKQTRKK